LWQANAAGRYAHPDDNREDKPLDPNFRGFGRVATDAEGRYRFTTIRPGPVPGRGNALQAPHIAVALFARGLLKQLYTRIYFADETANDTDPVLSSITDPARRRTLLALRDNRSGSPTYRFDIVLQGERETAFFEI
jgi:protocatechuate 3,4-dioxygenase alpha subunit